MHSLPEHIKVKGFSPPPPSTWNWGMLLLLMFLLLPARALVAQELDTSLTKEEWRQEKRLQRRLDLRNSHERTRFRGSFVQAFLTSTVSFDLADGLLEARLGLEKNLGLGNRQFFFSGYAYRRFTPRSGLYASYYGIKRSSSRVLQDDILFLQDTISLGTNISAFFNTQVLSLGYLLTIVDSPGAALSAYFNLYIMRARTGVSADAQNYEKEVGITAPLPDFGLLATFDISSRIEFNGRIGFFALTLKNFGGRIDNLNLSLNFKPAPWIGINIGYQQFDLRVFFPSEGISTTVDYYFRGPELGLSLMF